MNYAGYFLHYQEMDNIYDNKTLLGKNYQWSFSQHCGSHKDTIFKLKIKQRRSEIYVQVR